MGFESAFIFYTVSVFDFCVISAYYFFVVKNDTDSVSSSATEERM